MYLSSFFLVPVTLLSHTREINFLQEPEFPSAVVNRNEPMVCTLLSHISSCHCGSDMPVYNVFLHKLTSSESNESKISIRSDLWNGKLSSTLTGIVKVRGFLPCVLKNGEMGMS